MNEVTECADAVLGDFRQFSETRSVKEAEHKKTQEHINKSLDGLKKQHLHLQHELKNMNNSVASMKKSVPSDEQMQKLTNEMNLSSDYELSLANEFKEREPVRYPMEDFERLQALKRQLSEALK